jgi:hypothetical protein
MTEKVNNTDWVIPIKVRISNIGIVNVWKLSARDKY